MSDRLAVLDAGRLLQVGTPSEVYSTPTSARVATFLGTTNLWDAEVVSSDGDGLCCRVGDVDLHVAAHRAEPGATIAVMVRPERVEVSRPTGHPDGANVLAGRVATLTFRGAHTSVLLDCRGLRLEAEVGNVAGSPPEWLHEGSEVTAQVSPHALHVLERG